LVSQTKTSEYQKIFYSRITSDLKSKKSRNTDYILFTLSSGTNLQMNNLQIKTDFASEIELKQNASDVSEIHCRIHDVATTGNTKYRGFDLSSAIKPDVFDGRVVIRLFGQESLNRNFKQVEISEFQPSVIHQVYAIDISRATNIELYIDQIDFSSMAIDRFNKQIQLVDRYWATRHLIDSVLKRIEKYELAEKENVVELFSWWDMCHKASHLADSMINNNTLLLNITDPAGLIQSHDKIFRMKTRLKTLLLSTSERIDSKSLLPDNFINYHVSLLADFRKLSTRIDYKDSEIFYEAGRLIPDTEYVKLLSEVDNRIFKGQSIQLIYESLIRQGDLLKDQEDYAHALDYYDDALKLNTRSPAIRTNLFVNENRKLVIEGMMKSMVQIAVRALESKNSDLLDNYLTKSIELKNRHLRDLQLINIEKIIDPLVNAFYRKGIQLLDYNRFNEAVNIFKQLEEVVVQFDALPQSWPGISHGLSVAHKGVYNELIQVSEQYYKQGDYFKADEFADYARHYQVEHSNYIAASTKLIDLKRKIQDPILQQSIQDGITAINSGQSAEALQTLNKSREKVKEFDLTATASIDSLTGIAAKTIIINKIKSADIKVWANNLDDAWAIYEEAVLLQKKYNLIVDQDIRSAFENLDKKIIDRICLNHQLTYEELILKINRSIRFERYDELQHFIQEATTLVNENQGCGLESGIIEQLISDNSPLFDYLSRFNSIMNQMYESGFGSIISAYDALDNDVEKSNPEATNYKHLSILDFLQNQNNKTLTRIALKYYTDIRAFDKALKCLILLKLQGEDMKISRDVQQQLALSLAEHDSARKNIRNADQKAVEYVGNSNWFNTFRHVYSKNLILAVE